MRMCVYVFMSKNHNKDMLEKIIYGYNSHPPYRHQMGLQLYFSEEDTDKMMISDEFTGKHWTEASITDVSEMMALIHQLMDVNSFHADILWFRGNLLHESAVRFMKELLVALDKEQIGFQVALDIAVYQDVTDVQLRSKNSREICILTRVKWLYELLQLRIIDRILFRVPVYTDMKTYESHQYEVEVRMQLFFATLQMITNYMKEFQNQRFLLEGLELRFDFPSDFTEHTDVFKTRYLARFFKTLNAYQGNYRNVFTVSLAGGAYFTVLSAYQLMYQIVPPRNITLICPLS